MIARFLVLLLFSSVFARAESIPGKRPVIIGASLSDGFYLPEFGIPFVSPKSKALGFHHYLKGATEAKVLNLGSNWLFMAPKVKGAFQVKKAKEFQPTAVFAVDFLFWYLYGSDRTRVDGDRQLSRLEFFELGLAQLAQFDCPVVVGNIPDVSESVGIILSPNQYAGKETIVAANRRLEEWLVTHDHAVKVDLASFHRKASSNLEMVVGEVSIPAGKSRELFLQWDLLHPTADGVRALAGESVRQLKGGE